MAAQVRDYFAEHLELKSATNSGRETIVLLDEAHNFFLAHPDGFEGYRVFQKMRVETAPTHFWYATFNHHSWNYLNGVFGTALGWPRSLEMPPFSENDLRQLIMKHHHRTKFRLSYDTIISAAQSPDELGAAGQIETQFFRLLWGQSKGNPRTGLVLWLSSLRRAADGRLHVSIPQYQAPKALLSMSDDQLSVCAAVVGTKIYRNPSCAK